MIVLSTMAIPEIIHKYNMIQTEQIIFRNAYVSTHIHVIIINEKGSMGSKRTRSGICDRKGRLRKKKY